MNDIRTYNGLLEEKKRLEEALVIQKGLIRQDLAELREELSPVIQLVSMVGKMARNPASPLIAMGVGLAGEVFLKNRAISRGGNIVRLLVPFLAKQVTTLFHNQDNQGKGTLLQKLAGLWKKTRSNGHVVR